MQLWGWRWNTFPIEMLFLKNIRKHILKMIYNLYSNTENLSDTDKLIWLMTTEDPDMLHLLQQLLSSLSEERINRFKH